MTPILWISNFKNELKGKEINPFLFSLLMANKFKGDIYVFVDEFETIYSVCKIEENFYHIEGEMSGKFASQFIPLNKLSVLHYTQLHEQIKWNFK